MIGFYIASKWLLGDAYYFNFFLAGVIGVLTALAFVFLTQYYTEYKYRPVQSIAEAQKLVPQQTSLLVSLSEWNLLAILF